MRMKIRKRSYRRLGLYLTRAYQSKTFRLVLSVHRQFSFSREDSLTIYGFIIRILLFLRAAERTPKTTQQSQFRILGAAEENYNIKEYLKN